MKNIKVIVVDDSALMRKIISDMINSSEDMEVMDTCRNGKDLLDKLLTKSPDVITLDVEMPIMDGLTTLREMKKMNNEIPTIVLSSISQKGTQLTIDCLESGAFDIVPKPSGTISLDIDKVKDELLDKIKAAFEKKRKNDIRMKGRDVLQTKPKAELKSKIDTKFNFVGAIEAVVIGASTGGPKALYTVVTSLPQKLGVPVFIVQHMPVGFTKAFADRLNSNSDIKVVEAKDKEIIENDVVYIAPGGFHMEVDLDKKIHLNSEPSIWGVRPAVDKLFLSASKVYGSHLLSVILTGMGKDGANGTSEIKKKGGITISEDESTCTIYGMPKAAYETGMVDIVLPIEEVPIQIVKILNVSRR